jgi:hypothetical protein
MIQTNLLCRSCHQPMIGISIGNYFRIVCNNFGCQLYRQGQGNIEKQVNFAPVQTFMPTPLPAIPLATKRHLVPRKRTRKKTIRRRVYGKTKND